ncbi:MAG: NAD(P)H-hydrate dehydratase [Rhizobiaceae bacterium]|nr:NAD(P)H-hydrate dehydratase [Rhizobiaceae bacterium]
MALIVNHPDLWKAALPKPDRQANKYHRGFVGIYAAPLLTGATRLAATACNRIGAGLVSVVAPSNGDIYRCCLPADIMVQSQSLTKMDIGLGGSGGITQQHHDELLAAKKLKARIFDADGLPAQNQFAQLDGNCILTPHFGEFERIFGAIEADHVIAAQRAAEACGAIIVLKSADTIIASPDGQIACNSHASPYLAKAGTGDVLAGLIAGLVAQNMPHFHACCAATWIHGEAAIRFGPGLVASDISDMVPGILTDLLA